MEEKPLSNWYAVQIGTLIGAILFSILGIVIFLPDLIRYGLVYFQESLANSGIIYVIIALVLFGCPIIPLGIIGALIGNLLKKTKKAVWVGGLIGALPIPVLLFINFMIDLLYK